MYKANLGQNILYWIKIVGNKNQLIGQKIQIKKKYKNIIYNIIIIHTLSGKLLETLKIVWCFFLYYYIKLK